MTERSELEKVIDGYYRLGRATIVRNGKTWIAHLPGQSATEPTRKLAVLAARVLLGEATSEESAEYSTAKGA